MNAKDTFKTSGRVRTAQKRSLKQRFCIINHRNLGQNFSFKAVNKSYMQYTQNMTRFLWMEACTLKGENEFM